MKKLTDKSLLEIALYFGRSDHSTVIHAIKQIQEKIHKDVLFSQQIHRLQEEIKGA
jgi:chromosomal replication initiator protein